MMEAALNAMLIAQPAIAALVIQPTSPATYRIYPILLPQAFTSPAITYQTISGPRDYTQQGADGVVTFRVQIDIWASTFAAATQLRDAITSSISGMYNVHYAGVHIHGVFVDNERTEYENALDDVGPRLWRISTDFQITMDAI